MMAMRKVAFGHWLMVAALAGGLSAAALAAPDRTRSRRRQRTRKMRQRKSAPKKDEPNITAPHAILIDAENGSVLFERDADRLIFPASLAKLMTAEYVFHEIKEGRIKLTDEYMVSENAWRKGGAPSHGSTMFAALNSKVPVDDLLHGMIIQSANDACIVLAEGIAGNEAEFGDKLTQRAREIGLGKIGLHQFQRPARSGRAGDDARTGDARAPHHPHLSGFLSILRASPISPGTRSASRTAIRFLVRMSGADGLKTGFTKEAGYGLVGSAVQNDLRLIVVVNGCQHRQGTRRRSQEDAGMGLPEFRTASIVCRRPDDR